MRPTIIFAHDLPEAWFRCLWELANKHLAQKVDESYAGSVNVYDVQRGSFAGSHRRYELSFLYLHVENPGRRPLAPFIPDDLRGRVPPPTSDEYIEEYFVEYLLSPRLRPGEQYTYGSRIFDYVGSIIDMLKDTPGTNQAVLEVARPEDLRLPDPPCLRLIQFKAVDGALHCTVYFRSWDLWAGLPTNLGGIQLLKEYVAHEAGLRDGTLTAVSPGAHVYDYAWPYVTAVLRIRQR